MSEEQNELSNAAILSLELELGALQDEHIDLKAAYQKANDRITGLVAERDSVSPLAQSITTELKALATTYRTAQRNGHPDAAKHLEKLLGILGAA